MKKLNSTYKQFNYAENPISAPSIMDDQKQDFEGGSVTFRNEHWLS